MNLLEVERKFKKLEAQEDRVRYFYNPGAKYVKGKRQHVYIDELRNDAGMDKRRFGMNPYITNEEEFQNIRNEEEITAESQRASQTTQNQIHRTSVPTASESSLPTPAPQRPQRHKSKKKLSEIRNTAALMKIIVKPNASQKHLTALMGRNISKPLTLNSSYSSPGFLSQHRPSRVRKLGGIYSSLKLRFSLQSKAQVFALRITDVALPEKPTRQVTHCAKTADGYLLVAEETVVHPSLIVPWAVDNHPCTLLWEVREQESLEDAQGEVLIRHITFMRSFQQIYVPQIFLQIMGFFAELNSDKSPFTKFYKLLTMKRTHLLQDFKALEELYVKEMPSDLQYPYIEGFGPPFVVEFQDRVVQIEGLTSYRIIKDVNVFEQLSQRTVYQPKHEFTPFSSDMMLSQQKAPIIPKKQSIAPIQEAYGRTDQSTPIISPPNQPVGLVPAQGLAQLSGNTDLSQSVGVLAAQYSTVTNVTRSFQRQQVVSGDDSYQVRRKPSTASCPYRNQMGKIILSVRSQRRQTEVQRGVKRGKLSSIHSHHTGTPPSTLSPRIQSMTGGYYRLPSQDSKTKDLNKNDSLLRPHPADKIEIRKLYPPQDSTPPQPLIQEKSMEYSRDSYWPSPTPLPPMLAPEARAILRISPVKRRLQNIQVSRPKPNQFTLLSQSPHNFTQATRAPPALPYWMREGSPDELTIQGVQLIESRFNELDYY